MAGKRIRRGWGTWKSRCDAPGKMGREANQPAFLAPASFSAAIAALQFRSGATVSGGLDRKRVARIQPAPCCGRVKGNVAVGTVRTCEMMANCQFLTQTQTGLARQSATLWRLRQCRRVHQCTKCQPWRNCFTAPRPQQHSGKSGAVWRASNQSTQRGRERG